MRGFLQNSYFSVHSSNKITCTHGWNGGGFSSSPKRWEALGACMQLPEFGWGVVARYGPVTWLLVLVCHEVDVEGDLWTGLRYRKWKSELWSAEARIACYMNAIQSTDTLPFLPSDSNKPRQFRWRVLSWELRQINPCPQQLLAYFPHIGES